MKDDSLNDQVDSEDLSLRINQLKEPNPNSVGMVDKLYQAKDKLAREIRKLKK